MGSDSISFACGQTESAVTLGRKEKWGKVRFRLYVAPEIESDPVFFPFFRSQIKYLDPGIRRGDEVSSASPIHSSRIIQ